VLETGGRRRKGQRILYFFRTPPSIRVGREAIDPEAMRMLEEHNPEVSFDWGRLLKQGAQGSTGSSGSSGSGSAGSRDERRRQRREQRHRGEQSAPPAMATGSVTRLEAVPTEPETGSAPESEMDSAPTDEGYARGTVEVAQLAANPEPQEPREPGEPEEPGEPGEPDSAVPARFSRLGPDTLRRLRARYADLKERIAARPAEDAERAELMTRVERLNPDAWLTEGEVGHALEEYEAVFESIRPLVGRPGRRRS
jgi:hypothetical protein